MNIFSNILKDLFHISEKPCMCHCCIYFTIEDSIRFFMTTSSYNSQCIHNRKSLKNKIGDDRWIRCNNYILDQSSDKYFNYIFNKLCYENNLQFHSVLYIGIII